MSALSAENAELVHRLFRGSAEVAKWARGGSLYLEVVAAIVAGWRALFPGYDWPAWASLLLVAVLLVAFVLRLWAKHVYSFSERSRRIGIMAYAFDRPVSGATLTSLMAAAPIGTEKFAAKLPTQSLQDYYESDLQPGFGRLRELYAHSAFYSWRLFDTCSKLYLLVAVSFSLVGILVVYALAASQQDTSTADKLLDMVCSVVVAFFATRAFEAFVDTRSSANESKRVADEMLDAADSKALELASDYDVERASGRTIPTRVYLHYRDKLQIEWSMRRLDIRA